MKTILQSIRMLGVLTLILGVGYPAIITVTARFAFPDKATGSLVNRNGAVVGSALLAQKFESPRYFWGRPSAGDFATVPSGASNLGPTSAKQQDIVKERSTKWRAALHLAPDAVVPKDLLEASGSGLDPHISPEAAQFQIARVAQARNLEESRVADLVERAIEPPQLGVFGEPRVNVLTLNQMLDTL